MLNRSPEHPWRNLLLGLSAAAWLTGCNVVPTSTPRGPATPTPTAPRKPLLMHYMPWYETPAIRGQWGSHWKGHDSQHHPDQVDPNGLPDLWSHYHPLIGPYDSSDPDVLECHLLQMKLAGIDGVIVDWYGLGTTADHPSIHKATQAVFDATERFGLQFAACYEDRAVKLLVDWNQLAPDQTTNRLAETLQWMQESWFSKSHYFRLHGRPLLLNFGPIYFAEAAAWDAAFAALPQRPAFFGLHHLWKTAGADGGFTWVHLDPWENTEDQHQIRTRIGEVFTYFTTNPAQSIVSAYPGYNDVYPVGHRELPHRNGQTLRETLEVALAGPWSIIQLVTWNDYGEGTMIEPTHEFGYTFLEIVQQERREEAGGVFSFSAEDLRLPARLYALRKSGGYATEQLDAIAQLLNSGHTQEARARIERAETTAKMQVSPGPS